jgi:predicted ribosome quality control (RQC) complex YloA/Tae2 family protein
MLAAHFSAARDETHVDVSYVPRKFVRKPRNGVPGQVLIDREKVLALRVDSERLRALLGREEV